jgi:hypothetical protein
MHARIPALLAAALLLAQVALAATDDAVLKDLTAVITLHGQPCGEVTKADRKGDNDFIATCKDGNKYRVRTKDERVVVEKQ